MSTPAADGRGPRRGCLFVGLGLLLGVVVGVPAIFFGFNSLIGDRLPREVPKDSVSLIAADQQGTGFYAKVEFADKSSLWLKSSDGGATWAKAEAPTEFNYNSYDTTHLDCADDGVCYLSYASTGDARYRHNVVDRIQPDHTWRNELDKVGGECWAENLVVNPANSDEALVTCSETTLAYRAGAGDWREVELARIAASLR